MSPHHRIVYAAIFALVLIFVPIWPDAQAILAYGLVGLAFGLVRLPP